MGQWYRVEVYRAHSNGFSSLAYIYAENIIKVLDRYKLMPGVKRNLDRAKFFPSILPASEREVRKLEREILEGGTIPLEMAKKTWYYLELV